MWHVYTGPWHVYTYMHLGWPCFCPDPSGMYHASSPAGIIGTLIVLSGCSESGLCSNIVKILGENGDLRT